MTLPTNIKTDVESKQTLVKFRIIIKGRQENIYISSHSTNFEGNFYKPLLLNTPSVKQSIDYESRMFKTSTVSLTISNYEYQGEIFSDHFKANTWMSSEVDIYIDSQSTKDTDGSFLFFKGHISRLSHDDSTAKIQLEDATQIKFNAILPKNKASTSTAVGDKYRGAVIPIVFGNLGDAPAILDGGNVLKADSDESVQLTRDEHAWHPFSGADTEWTTFTYDWGADDDYRMISPAKIYSDGAILHICEKVIREIENEETLEVSELDFAQLTYNEDVHQAGTVQINSFSSESGKLLQVAAHRKPSSISCHFRSSLSVANMDGVYVNEILNLGDDGWGTPNRFRAKMSNALTDTNYNHVNDIEYINGVDPFTTYDEDSSSAPFPYSTLGATSYISGNDYVSQGLIRISFASTPEFEHVSLHDATFFAINGRRINLKEKLRVIAYYSRKSDDPSVGDYEIHRWSFHTPYEKWQQEEFWLDGQPVFMGFGELGAGSDSRGYDLGNLFKFTYDGQIDSDENYSGSSESTTNMIDIKDLTSTGFQKGFIRFTEDTKSRGEINMTIGAMDYNPSIAHDMEAAIGLGGYFHEVDLLSLADIEFKKDSNFFLSVSGRKNAVGNLITDPLSILIKIYQDELNNGIDAMIDTTTFAMAAADVGSLKFDFSVHKEIEAKKLFENIAKSTFMFPCFYSNGDLAFPTIRNAYGTGWIDSNSRIIKASDVINYSFNKTKLEEVYTKIEFHYNYNYMTEKYDSVLKDGLYPNDEELIFNNHVDVEGNPDPDANILKFETPYIKDDDTAIKVWRKMFRFYKNQKLTCKIRLPISYMDIELGTHIKFDELLGGLKAYGIDYTTLDKVIEVYFGDNSPIIAGNITYPMFFVTSVSKNIDYVEIEALHIHALDEHLGQGWGNEYLQNPNEGDATVNCQDGYYWNGEACVPFENPSNWEEGVDLGIDPSFPTESECPPGYYWDGNACVEIPQCPEGYYWDGNACVEAEIDLGIDPSFPTEDEAYLYHPDEFYSNYVYLNGANSQSHDSYPSIRNFMLMVNNIPQDSRDVKVNEIAHWFNPGQWGLEAWDDLLPEGYNDYGVIFIEFVIKIYDTSDENTWDYVLYCQLRGLESVSGESSGIGWYFQLHNDENTIGGVPFRDSTELLEQDSDGASLMISSNNWRIGTNHMIGHSIYDWDNDSYSPDTHLYRMVHTIRIHELFKNMYDLGDNTVDNITFNPSYQALLLPYDMTGHLLGDVNLDEQLSVLDIVAIVNHILGVEVDWEYEYLADFNQDTTVNILDIVAIMHTIVGVGDN